MLCYINWCWETEISLLLVSTTEINLQYDLTLFAQWNLISFLRFAFALIRNLAGDWAGHVELVNVQRCLAERGHGWVHACIAIGGTAKGSQVQSLPTGDDGDVEGQFAAAVGRRGLGDSQRGWGGELAAGTGRLRWLSIEELVVLAAREKQLQGSMCQKVQEEGLMTMLSWFKPPEAVKYGHAISDNQFNILKTFKLNWNTVPFKSFLYKKIINNF